MIADGLDIASKLFPNFWTFVTQLGSTFILFLAFRKFLYQPVVAWLDKRAQLSQDDLEAAKIKHQEADSLLALAQQEKRALALQGQELLDKAREEALSVRKDMVDQAKKDIDAMILKGQEDLAAQKEAVLEELNHEMADLVIETTKKVLATQSLSQQQHQAIDQFVKEMRN